MNFILTAGWDDGIADLTERIVRELASGKRVLWLTSGGSNVPATAQVMDNIPKNLRQKLTILLADERYGPVGHFESNWAQQIKAGFKPEGCNALPVLQAGISLESTVARYDKLAQDAFANQDIVIAQLGVGPDGHIAGLLLESPALDASNCLVTSYLSQEEPPLMRMTLTFDALHKIDAAYCFAFGKPKRAALKNLEREQLPLSEQPAQILKGLPEAYVYNDQVGHHGR